MPTPTVTLQSITGVDVELRIAGPGSRSYAFVIDWHIRLLLALAWLFAGQAIYAGRLAFLGNDAAARSPWYFFAVIVPPLAIYFLYHPVLEMLMHGRTPGKRIAGVRLVSRSGDIPGIGALLLRNVFRIIDSMPFLYLVGLGFVIFSHQHVRIGDMAAGTLLVMDNAESDKSFGSLAVATEHSGLNPKAADLVAELLDRWDTLNESTRTDIARRLIARIEPNSIEAAAGETAAQLQSRLKALLTRSHAA